MIEHFNEKRYYSICDQLAALDEDLKGILDRYGYPPFWVRPNTFESLVHIILEQQVSLASALAAMNQLKAKIGPITPEAVLDLSDGDLRACYFSRQKTLYVRDLALNIITGALSLEALELMDEDDVRHQLKMVKGIGAWTIDIYLLFILHRTDVFPLGDLAAVNALKQLKDLDSSTSKADLLIVASNWKPYRSIATMMLWHYYLEQRRLKHK